VKRTLEWSKIIFGERNGFWATAREQIFSTIRAQSSFSMKFYNRAANCEKFAYFIENFLLRLASAV
jgi:hypothetical protein